MTDGARKLIDPVEIGRKGGLSRAKKLSKKQRIESARKAAKARWAQKGPK